MQIGAGYRTTSTQSSLFCDSPIETAIPNSRTPLGLASATPSWKDIGHWNRQPPLVEIDQIRMTGNSGVIGGTMVADSFNLSGGAGGSIQGTILSLGTAPFELGGGASISRSPGKVPLPAGLLLPLTFKPVPETYLEVHP